MIRRLKLQNFKAIRSAEIDFERFTVFAGPNASGKTSVLQALEHVAEAVHGEHGAHRHELAARLTRGSHGPLSIETSGDWEGRYASVRLIMERDPPSFYALGELDGNVIFDDRTFRARPANSLFEQWWSVQLLRLEPRRLAEPSVAEGENPRIGSDGSGLASVLAQMALNRPNEFDNLTETLQEIIPHVLRVRMSLAQIRREERESINIDGQSVSRMVERKYGGHRLVLDMVGAADIPGEEVSEGTILVLGLLAVVMSPSRPSLLLLDDLDRGLHPRAQRELIDCLRGLLARFPDLQIIATSHSPYLVDCMKPEEVRLTTVRRDGSTHCAPLKNHPRFSEWKDVMRSGEFWSTVGEDWIKSTDATPQGNA